MKKNTVGKRQRSVINSLTTSGNIRKLIQLVIHRSHYNGINVSFLFCSFKPVDNQYRNNIGNKFFMFHYSNWSNCSGESSLSRCSVPVLSQLKVQRPGECRDQINDVRFFFRSSLKRIVH